jgi:hypothetical protein
VTINVALAMARPTRGSVGSIGGAAATLPEREHAGGTATGGSTGAPVGVSSTLR